MKKKYIVIASSIIAVLLGVGFLYYQKTKSPEPKKPVNGNTTQDDKNNTGNIFKGIIPADSTATAAGICEDGGEESVALVTVNVDTPTPRCRKVFVGQKLKIKNNTDLQLFMWFGDNREYSFEVPKGGEYQIPESIDKILSLGVHILHGSPYSGPEIVLEEKKEAMSLPKGTSTNSGSSTTNNTTQNNPPAGILPYDSGIMGTVFLGLTCPVVRNPPDPECADKPYSTEVRIISKSGVFASAKSDENGKFRFFLPPGDFVLEAVGGDVYPRCASQNITVDPSIVKQINITCDTGIR